MESQASKSRLVKSGKSKIIKYVEVDQKIEIEIHDVMRIRPNDLNAFKNAYEEFATQWD